MNYTGEDGGADETPTRPSPRAHSAIPSKRATGGQVERELDPREAERASPLDLKHLHIEPQQLFSQAIEQTRMALCVSDPHREDCPIVFANQAFLELTGYEYEEVVGQNCRFLQGADTDPSAVQRIRDAISNERVVVVDLLNYRKDGTAFWNAVHIGPIFDETGRLQYLYGSQWDVTEIFNEREEAIRQRQVAAELQHRNGNLFSVLGAIVRLSAKRGR